MSADWGEDMVAVRYVHLVREGVCVSCERGGLW